MEIVQIKAESRESFGKKATKLLRKQGMIPAVMYSKNGTSHFTTKHADVKSMVYTPQFKLAEIEINGKSTKALLKEITFHPVTEEIEHIDFLELVDGQPLKASIPVQFKGTSPGVKGGGKLIRTLRTVGVKCKPEDLVDCLYVNIDDLELGQSVRVRDIEITEGIELMVDGATPVAKVEVPRALKSEDEEAAEEALAEGEVEGEGEASGEGDDAQGENKGD